MLFIISLGLVLTSACASRVDLVPEPDGKKFVETSRGIRQQLAYCPPSSAYACTERVACEATFPAQPDQVTIAYQMIAGFDRVTVVVEPEGYVSEIRRKERRTDGLPLHTSTPCAENLLAAAAPY
jgi:hypothetical protein